MGQDQIATILKNKFESKNNLIAVNAKLYDMYVVTSSSLGHSGSATSSCCHYVCK